MKRFNHNVMKIKNQETGKWEGFPAIVGESAYELAVRLGTFSGTEEEYNNFVNESRDAAISEVEKKGQETLATIPEDYAQLQADVDTLFFEIGTNTVVKLVKGSNVSFYEDVNIELKKGDKIFVEFKNVLDGSKERIQVYVTNTDFSSGSHTILLDTNNYDNKNCKYVFVLNDNYSIIRFRTEVIDEGIKNGERNVIFGISSDSSIPSVFPDIFDRIYKVENNIEDVTKINYILSKCFYNFSNVIGNDRVSLFEDYEISIKEGSMLYVKFLEVLGINYNYYEVYGFPDADNSDDWDVLLNMEKSVGNGGFTIAKRSYEMIRFRIPPVDFESDKGKTGSVKCLMFYENDYTLDGLVINNTAKIGKIEENINTLTENIKDIFYPTNKLTCKIFKRVCCCGDSYTSGYITDSSGLSHGTNEDYAWPHYMSTLTGNEWINCGSSGANAKTWQTAERGLIKAKSVGKVQAYIIGLMINDSSPDPGRNLTLGTIDDIGTETESFYGCYSKIIRELNVISPKAHIFVQTCPKTDSDRYDGYNKAVRDIYDAYKETYTTLHLLDLHSYLDTLYKNEGSFVLANDGHYTAMGYEQMAEKLAFVMSNYINENIDAFKDVPFIEYDSN